MLCEDCASLREHLATGLASEVGKVAANNNRKSFMSKTWFITGASRGIGAEIVKAALAAGHRVVATARDASKVAKAFDADLDQFLALPLDVTKEGQATIAVQAAVARFDGIDVLVNNAGYGQLGIFEENEAADAERQFATNVFGVLNVTRAVLPVIRQRRSGHIFNVSSIAGVRGALGVSLYCASKFAIEGFSEALSQEVEPLGIAVTIIEPGFFRTDFLDTSSVRYGEKKIADYEKASDKVRSSYEAKNKQQAGDPVKLAKVMLDLASHLKPPLRFAAGSDAVEISEAKIESRRTELAAWRALSLSTDGSF
jgi:NAD(P)-dependent dehydrogenase (short-subunit alcohol dehydrogenase family)